MWNQLDSDKRKVIQGHKLLITVLVGMKETESIIYKGIKLVCLLWIFAIQHRYFEEVYAALKDKGKNCLQMQLGLNTDEFQIIIIKMLWVLCQCSNY